MITIRGKRYKFILNHEKILDDKQVSLRAMRLYSQLPKYDGREEVNINESKIILDEQILLGMIELLVLGYIEIAQEKEGENKLTITSFNHYCMNPVRLTKALLEI